MLSTLTKIVSHQTMLSFKTLLLKARFFLLGLTAMFFQRQNILSLKCNDLLLQIALKKVGFLYILVRV